MSEVLFEAQRYPLAPGESVLDCLLAAGHDLPHSCKAGACQSCLMQAEGPVPAPRRQVCATPSVRLASSCPACAGRGHRWRYDDRSRRHGVMPARCASCGR